jgi:tripartite-type tricarboxylate transporter receptor subunit TctC
LAAFAQSKWPARPVAMLVQFPAGSASDILARTIANPLAQKLGQPFIVEDRGGADGMIASRAIARSNPDGYTLGFVTTTTWALEVNLQPDQMGFDPRTDYSPVSLLGNSSYLLIVNAALGVNSLQDLVALARSKPGSLNYSSTGEGSVAHLGMLILAKELGIQMTHVPYKSTAQSIIDLAGGRIQLQLATIAPTIPLYQAGKVRILGIASDKRSPLLPDVPTLQELGAPTTASFSMGLVYPAGTPGSIVKQVNEVVNDSLKEESIRASYYQQGIEPKGSSPEGLAQLIESEIETYRKIVAEFGVLYR